MSTDASIRTDRRIPEVDGLRAVAILTVLVWHFVHLRSEATPGTVWAKVNMLLRLSWSGVDLFFVLSGFLVGGILLAQRESPDYFRSFYGRRILRIFPLYYAFVGACLVLQTAPLQAALGAQAWIFQPSLPAWSLLTITQNLAMLLQQSFANQALNITWSLAVEEQFYILLPLLVRWVPLPRLPLVLIGLMLGGAAIRGLLIAVDPASAAFRAYILLPCRWDPLFLGVIFAWALRDPVWAPRLARLAAGLKPVLLGLLATAAWLAITARGVIMSPTMTVWGYPFLGLLYLSLLVLVIHGKLPRVAAVLRHPILVRIGTVSYGIYLFHEAIAGLFHGWFLGSRPRFVTPAEIAVTLAAALAAIALAEASWRLFEQPCVQWGHRHFRYRRGPGHPAVPAA